MHDSTALVVDCLPFCTDPVFGLLGDAAAAGGLGDTTDPDCLQQNLADLVSRFNILFRVVGLTVFRRLSRMPKQLAMLLLWPLLSSIERLSGTLALCEFEASSWRRALKFLVQSSGLASVACNSTTAVNSEIAAISQHQDPASTGAAATNKAIVLTLAQQIASIGGDPQDALKSGTFAPGTLGDPTAAGNTCDNIVDEVSIDTQILLTIFLYGGCKRVASTPTTSL